MAHALFEQFMAQQEISEENEKQFVKSYFTAVLISILENETTELTKSAVLS